jgi:glycosidase
MQRPTLYEINTVLWLDELSGKYGKQVNLGTVPSTEWDKVRDCGFDYVWLMGVWERSATGRRIARETTELYPAYQQALPDWSPQDVVGSPYSIRRYRPDPLVGGWEDLEKARRQLARRNAGLILDFVPNHTGIDFPWVQRTPQRYVAVRANDQEKHAGSVRVRSSGQVHHLANGRDPFFPPWTDTLQLDAFNAVTRKALSRLVGSLSKRCDGVRCDMAMLLLNDVFTKTWGSTRQHTPPAAEFWQELIAAHPSLLWLAEAYWDTEWLLQQQGFDYVYDKGLYDRLRFSSAQDVRLHLGADLDFQTKLIRFIENHDEERSAVCFDPGRLRAAVILVSTLPGMRMYFQGQFEGRKLKIPVQLRRSAHELPNTELQEFYRTILQITSAPPYRSGQWQLLSSASAGDETYRNFLAYTWRSESRQKLVVVNFGQSWGQARLRFQVETARNTCRLTDELHGRRYTRDPADIAERGLHVLLEGYGSHLFDLEVT